MRAKTGENRANNLFGIGVVVVVELRILGARKGVSRQEPTYTKKGIKRVWREKIENKEKQQVEGLRLQVKGLMIKV